jgi:hypothetical protein
LGAELSSAPHQKRNSVPQRSENGTRFLYDAWAELSSAGTKKGRVKTMKIKFESLDEIRRLRTLLDGIHAGEIVVDIGALMRIEIPELSSADESVDKPVNKEVDKVMVCKAVGKGSPPRECDDPNECEYCSYVSGQLDMVCRCIRACKLTLKDAAAITGRSVAEIRHLYQMWMTRGNV